MNIGLVGSGAIGQYLLKNINKNSNGDLNITSVFVRNYDKYKHLEQQYKVKLFTDLNEFLAADIEIVVEAANVETSKELLPDIIKIKDTMLISIGALADEALLKTVSAKDSKTLHLPSGGIGGLDLVQNARALGNLDKVTLTTRKPAASLIDEAVAVETVVFEGKAGDAIDKFPKNMNISIILSLAGLGIDKTNVVLIADPAADKNTHTINISGGFGDAELTISNNPLPENPKTSALAALSVYATLERMSGNVKIGN